MVQEAILKNTIRRPSWNILLCLLGFLAAISPSSAQTTIQYLNWNDVLSAFDCFLNDPSIEKAASLASFLPKGVPGPNVATGDQARALDYILAAENFGILATEAAFGNENAVVVLLRLLNYADGFSAEEILGAIGRIVRFQPKLFLKVMSENWDMSLIRNSGPPVDFPLYAYNNHPGAYRHELKMRIEALKSVNDPTLAEIKEACLKRLVGKLKGLE
ncbi:MAG: hypothetical protein MUE80_02030 [Acidobacteria bacterium]|jgi:hypothetical protein|nr:hypothetical protein [Acidobacteriota bacterium]